MHGGNWQISPRYASRSKLFLRNYSLFAWRGTNNDCLCITEQRELSSSVHRVPIRLVMLQRQPFCAGFFTAVAGGVSQFVRERVAIPGTRAAEYGSVDDGGAPNEVGERRLS